MKNTFYIVEFTLPLAPPKYRTEYRLMRDGMLFSGMGTHTKESFKKHLESLVEYNRLSYPTLGLINAIKEQINSGEVDPQTLVIDGKGWDELQEAYEYNQKGTKRLQYVVDNFETLFDARTKETVKYI